MLLLWRRRRRAAIVCSETLRSRVLVSLSAGNVFEAELWRGVSGVTRAASGGGLGLYCLTLSGF